MAMCRRLVLGLVIFMLGEQPSWLNPTQGNWTVNSQRVAGNCKNVLLPFGPAAGDTTYPAGFDVGGNINPSFGPIALPSGVRLLNSGPYNNPYINAQGVISFEAPQASLVTNLPVVGTSTAMIMVNPMDLASSSIADGNIFYRVVEASDAVAMADVLEATAIAWDTYPVYPALEWAFIVTWSCVRRNGGADSERQTFQFVLTTDGVTVATFHNFAEVNTPDDMLVGLQAGGAFAGDALSPSFFLNQYNACPCGRWALQVHDVFTMPMSGIKACPGDCSYDEPEGCVDCMAPTTADQGAKLYDFDSKCRCELLNPTNSDPTQLQLISFHGDPVTRDFPTDTALHKVLIAAADTKSDRCKFSVTPSLSRDSADAIRIRVVEIRFGKDPDTNTGYHKLLKVKAGKNLFIHPDRFEPLLPFMYGNDNITVIIEELEHNGFRVHSPECEWSVVFFARDLTMEERAIAVYSNPRFMDETAPCGVCVDETLIPTTTLLPVFQFACQCLVNAFPEPMAAFQGAPLDLDTTIPDGLNSVKYTLVETDDNTDPCKFSVTVTIKETNGAPYLAIVEIRFGQRPDTFVKYDKLLKIFDGNQLALHPVRTEPVPPFAYENGEVTVMVEDLAPNAFKVFSPTCEWTIIYYAKDLDLVRRHLSIDMGPIVVTPGNPCGECVQPPTTTTPTPPTTVALSHPCQCLVRYPPGAVTPMAALDVTLFDGSVGQYGLLHPGTVEIVMATTDKTDPCKVAVKIRLNVESDGALSIGILEVRFGLHPDSNNKYANLLKVKAGTNLFLHPDRQNIFTPYQLNLQGDVTVTITDSGLDGFLIESPGCGWTVLYQAKSLPKLERSVTVATEPQLMEGACGTCDTA